MVEEQKAEVVYAFLDEVLGKLSLHTHTIDMPHLGLPASQLPSLTKRFS
jgi:hypothetical protein